MVPNVEETQPGPSVTVMGDVGCCALFRAVRFRRDVEKLEKLNHHEKPRHRRADEQGEGLSSLYGVPGTGRRGTEVVTAQSHA